MVKAVKNLKIMTAYLHFFVQALALRNVIFLVDVFRFLVQNNHTKEYSIAEKSPGQLQDTEKTRASRQHTHSFRYVTNKQRLSPVLSSEMQTL